MYLIPKEIRSKRKITQYFYLKEFLIFIGSMVLVFMFDKRVHSSIKYAYYLFCIVITGFLLWRSSSNPDRSNLEVLIYTLKKDNQTYYPLDTENQRVFED